MYLTNKIENHRFWLSAAWLQLYLPSQNQLKSGFTAAAIRQYSKIRGGYIRLFHNITTFLFHAQVT